MLNKKSLLVPLSENQTRQYVDGEALLRAWISARKEAREVRGSMFWRTLRGNRYLIRTTASGAQRSLGPESASLVEIHSRFMKRKRDLEARVKTLAERLGEQKKLNRVYRVGRAPNIVVRILQEIFRAGIDEQFLAVGTHALYAYESACGVTVGTDALATRDIDLLFDTRRALAFLGTMRRLDTSFIGLLQRADASFRVRRDQLQTAVNDDGFEVDLIRRIARDGDSHPLRLTPEEGDLWAVQVASGERMLSSSTFEQMIVATSGEMALMRTIHPLGFVKIKTELAASPTRDPLKKGKDALQAQVVQQLWDEYLRHRYSGAG